MNVRNLLIFVGSYIFTLNLDEQLALAEVWELLTYRKWSNWVPVVKIHVHLYIALELLGDFICMVYIISLGIWLQQVISMFNAEK